MFEVCFNSGSANEFSLTKNDPVGYIKIHNSDASYYKDAIIKLYDIGANEDKIFINSTVKIWINDSLEFSGYVSRIQKSIMGTRYFTLQCIGKTYDLWRYITSANTTFDDLYTGYIVSSLVSTYIPSSLVEPPDISPSSGVFVDFINLSNKKVGDAISRLSKFDGYHFFVDNNNKLQYYQTSPTSQFTISESDIIKMTPLEHADDHIKNDIVVIGDVRYEVEDPETLPTYKSGNWLPISSSRIYAQRFQVPPSGLTIPRLAGISFRVKRSVGSSAPKSLDSDIRYDIGIPSSNYLVSSAVSLPFTNALSKPSGAWIDDYIYKSPDVQVSTGQTYWLTLSYSGATTSDYWKVMYDTIGSSQFVNLDYTITPTGGFYISSVFHLGDTFTFFNSGNGPLELYSIEHSDEETFIIPFYNSGANGGPWLYTLNIVNSSLYNIYNPVLMSSGNSYCGHKPIANKVDSKGLAVVWAIDTDYESPTTSHYRWSGCLVRINNGYPTNREMVEYWNADTGSASVDSTYELGQTFKPSRDYTIKSAEIKVRRPSAPHDDYYAILALTSGSVSGSYYLPTGGYLVSGMLSYSDIYDGYFGSLAWHTFVFNKPYQLKSGQIYALVLTTTKKDLEILWRYDWDSSSDLYIRGNAAATEGTGTWHRLGASGYYDFTFRTYGEISGGISLAISGVKASADLIPLSSNKLVFVYNDNLDTNNADYGRIKGIIISGSTSDTTAVRLYSSSTYLLYNQNASGAVYGTQLSDNKFIISYTNDSDNVFLQMVTASGNTLYSGSSELVASNGKAGPILALSPSSAVYFYNSGSNIYSAYCRTGSISGRNRSFKISSTTFPYSNILWDSNKNLAKISSLSFYLSFYQSPSSSIIGRGYIQSDKSIKYSGLSYYVSCNTSSDLTIAQYSGTNKAIISYKANNNDYGVVNYMECPYNFDYGDVIYDAVNDKVDYSGKILGYQKSGSFDSDIAVYQYDFDLSGGAFTGDEIEFAISSISTYYSDVSSSSYKSGANQKYRPRFMIGITDSSKSYSPMVGVEYLFDRGEFLGEYWTTWNQFVEYYGDEEICQRFVVGVRGPNKNILVDKVSFFLSRMGSPGSYLLRIYEIGSDGLPSRRIYGQVFDTNSISEMGEWFDINLGHPQLLRAGKRYGVSIYAMGHGDPGDNYIQTWRRDIAPSYMEGGGLLYSPDGGQTWTEVNDSSNIMFKIYGKEAKTRGFVSINLSDDPSSVEYISTDTYPSASKSYKVQLLGSHLIYYVDDEFASDVSIPVFSGNIELGNSHVYNWDKIRFQLVDAAYSFKGLTSNLGKISGNISSYSIKKIPISSIAYSDDWGISWSVDSTKKLHYKIGYNHDNLVGRATSPDSINTFGRHLFKIKEPLITTKHDAKKLAQKYLDTYVSGLKTGSITINGRTGIDLQSKFRLSGTYVGLDEELNISSYTQKIDKNGFTTTINYGTEPFDIAKKVANLESEVYG